MSFYTLAAIAGLFFAGYAIAQFFSTLNADPGDPGDPNVAHDLITPPSAKESAMAQAIAAAEGFGGMESDGVTPNVPTRNNNPGDLEADFGWGKDAAGHAIFPDAQTGWTYLIRQVRLMLTGRSKIYNQNWTFSQVATEYTGNDNADAWARNVTSALGIYPSTTLAEYAAS